ncbi:MAG: NAD-dependent malic enzyme [Planctomycetota bacterium]|nr:NAD-dependent malic enzyme [Planctomycetota bacterium]
MNTPPPNWQERYNAKFIITARLRLLDQPGQLAKVLDAAADAGASVGDIRIVGADSQHKIRDVQLFIVDRQRLDATIDVIKALDEVELLRITDEVLEIHRHGTIETRARVPLNTIMDLRMVYTPGVASVCQLIADNPETAWKYTSKGRRIAIVTNGSAVLGLGDIGPLAGLPVMEGKSAILAHFVKVSADPILIDSHDTDEIVDIVAKLSSNYGAIQLEDIAAPACFEIEPKLQDRLDIPVFHDDQHGTATVVVAGLINALKETNRRPQDCRAVILGAGAAGTAIARFLVEFGLDDVVVCDSVGAIWPGRAERMNPWKQRLAETTNKTDARGSLTEVIRGRNLFIGVSRPKVVSTAMIASMAADPIVFALANPVSEISVEDAFEAGAAIALDGRSMNNALAYPGIFRGALDARARRITHEMKVAAAEALAAAATDQLLPDMLDHSVHQRVAAAVAGAWTPADRTLAPV